MNTHILNTTRTRRYGNWKRATRAWLVAMLLTIFTLAMQAATVNAAEPGPSGNTPTHGSGGGTVYRPDPRGTVVSTGGGLTLDPNAPCIGTNQCLKYLQYEAHGTYALFNFFTMQPAVATVQVSTAAPAKQADGTYSFKGLPVASFAMSAAQMQHAIELDNLDPGTNYHFLIDGAKGPTGVDAQQVGTFTTLKRMVTVKIDQITVMDDSDLLSTGDLVFNLKVNGSEPATFPTAEMAAFNPALDSVIEWNSGETKSVGIQVKVAAGDQASVLIEGWDWDDQQQSWLMGQPIIIDQDAQGLAGDRADISYTFTVTDDEHGKLTPKGFTMMATDKSLKYKATGSIAISYE